MKYDFYGRTIFITGAMGAVGSCAVKEFSENGANIFAFDNSSRILGMQSSQSVTYFHGDITKQEDIRRAVTICLQKYMKIDYLLCAAGYLKLETIEDIQLRDIEKSINVNLLGTYLACQAVLPSMRECNFGKIVIVGSILGQTALPMVSVYSATKAALMSLSKGIEAEYSKYNVNSVCICPGFIKSDMLKPYLPYLLREEFFCKIPTSSKVLISSKEVIDLVLNICNGGNIASKDSCIEIGNCFK